jgi:hypothetical protein
MYDNENELTAAERAAFDALPRERTPSDMLEEHIVSELRNRGMLPRTTRRTRRFGAAWRIAAAIALFAGGIATGRFLFATRQSAAASNSIPAAVNAVESGNRAVSTVRNGNAPVAHKEMWL